MELRHTGVEHDSCLLDVKEHDRFDLSRLANTGKELTKFDMWERKLLDFSLRNTLLNLSFRRRSIQLISFDIDRIEDHLHDGKEYCIKSKPDTELPMPPATTDLSDRNCSNRFMILFMMTSSTIICSTLSWPKRKL